MKGLILLPLMLLVVSSFLGVCRLLGYVNFSGDVFSNDYYSNTGKTYDSKGNLSVGTDVKKVDTDTATVAMSAVASSGVLTLIITTVALAVASGITVLGSGLNSVSIMAIFKLGSLYGIWCLFSILAVVMFMEIPVFGLPLYFVLTLFYSIGVVSTVGFMG